MLTIGLVVTVIFIFLRNLLRNRHPCSCYSYLPDWNVGRDVSLGVQPQQSSPNGPYDPICSN